MAAYYCPERGSERAQEFLARQDDPAISWLTRVELDSALSRKVREQSLAPEDAIRIARLFREHVASGFFRMLSLECSDYEWASEVLVRFNTGLRSLDALHLAVARRESLSVATADAVMAKAAESVGLEVVSV